MIKIVTPLLHSKILTIRRKYHLLYCYTEANNQHIECYNKHGEIIHIVYFDAKNRYGYALT